MPKPVYFLCKVRLPSLRPVKACFLRVAEKSSFPPCRKRIFRTILGRTACQSSGRKNQPFGKKMYDQREINNLMFNLIG
jgi:hypothetical protein